MMVLLHRISPPERIGEAAGLLMTLVNGTQTFLSTTFGAFGAMFGLSAIFWGMAALIGTGAWYAGRGLHGERRLHKPADEQVAAGSRGSRESRESRASADQDGGKH